MLREQLESASSDVLRTMVKTFADALMSAGADEIRGALPGRWGRIRRARATGPDGLG